MLRVKRSPVWVGLCLVALAAVLGGVDAHALFLKKTLKKVKNAADSATKTVTKAVTGAASTVKKKVTGGAKAVSDYAKKVIERSKSSLTRASDKFLKGASDFFAGLKGKLLAAKDKSVKALVGAYESAQSKVVETLRTKGIEAADTVFAGLANVVRKIGAALHVCKKGKEIEPASIFDPGKFKCVPKCPGMASLKAGEGVTFLVASDVHLGKGWENTKAEDNSVRLEDSRRHVREMQATADRTWPEGTASAGRKIGEAAGAVVTGDLTSHGHLANLEALKDLYETHRTEHAFRIPVYAGLGNHDHGDVDGVPDFNSKRMRRWVQKRMGNGCGGVTNIHSSTKHYSWDWAGIHFVQLNASFSETKYGQSGGPDWLTADLRKNVGTSGRPVVFFQHYGYDEFSKKATEDGGWWWSEAERVRFAGIVGGYNVIAMFTGHVHGAEGDAKNMVTAGTRTFPAYTVGVGGEGPANQGGVHKGYFMVVRIANGKLDVTRYKWTSDAGAAQVTFKETLPIKM